ncbi:MAG: C39 family peptidase [Spirochaetales bacterium]|nr:C39 family peptidase [Spirochaetales bacterium]
MILKPEDYYTQRNNKYDPFNACMPTTRAMLYSALGYNKPETDLSFDDYIYHTLNTIEAMEFRDNKYPSLKGYPTHELHGMYGSYLDEKLFGKRLTDFRMDLTWDDFVSEIKRGRPVMTSGRFPGIDGHAFLICGYEAGELIIADPWGNYQVEYLGVRGTKGYGVRMNREDFEKIVKPGENKWGHICVM